MMILRSLVGCGIFCAGFLTTTALQGLDGYDVSDPPMGVFEEEWMEIFLGADKIGYSHSSMTRKGDDVHTRTVTRMILSRGAIPLSLVTESRTVETVDGRPLEFELINTMSNQPVTVSGKIDGERVKVETRQSDNSRIVEYPWIDGALMTWGLDRQSGLYGYAPGTEYSLSIYSPDIRLDGPVAARVEVGEKENYNNAGAKREGIRVQSTLKMDIADITTISWVDERGRTLKSELSMGGLNFTMYATDERTALSEFVPPDMFGFGLLSVDRTIPSGAQSVTYEIIFNGERTELSTWPDSCCQQISESESSGILVNVQRANHDDLRNKIPSPQLRGKDSYLADNAVLNITDPLLVTLAEEAAGDSRDSIEVADRLRRFASDYITDKNLTVGFAPASEVARNPSGDCSEHAVFLASLGRIAGLPTRVVWGLAFLPEFGGRKNVMGFHMWTQFLLYGQWVDFDAALGESECSPTRIAFFASSLDDNTQADIGLSLMQVLGRVEVRIVEINESAL